MAELNIIIPVYNEAGSIINNINRLMSWLQAHRSTQDYEIVVVDDGSTDGTTSLLDELSSQNSCVRTLHHKTNLGRGRALRTGFKGTDGAYVICLDADLSYGPEHILALLDPLVQEEADLTLASPYHPSGKVTNVPLQRAMISRVGNRILARGLNRRFNTVTCMVRGFRREMLEDLELVNDGKEIHLEILHKAQLLGYRIREVPAHLCWPDSRRSSTRKRRSVSRRSILPMRHTMLSHLIFSYMNSPGVLLYIPIVLLLMMTLGGILSLLLAFSINLAKPEYALTLTGVYHALRETLLDGRLTLTLTLFALIVMLIFVAFYFISSQAKYHFEESYIGLARMNRRLRRLEGRVRERSGRRS